MKALLLSAFLCITILFKAHLCAGQAISGLVRDSLNHTISFAGVNLKNQQGGIIAYTLTNESGAFSLNIPASVKNEKLFLEVLCIGYKKSVRIYSEEQKIYEFVLTTDNRLLDPVTVSRKQPFIKIEGDTLNYSVTSFSNAHDRVIGDVLKKMPGIKLDPDGKISYNGKAISNLYIDGDNLLDDRYNIATRSIPSNAVEKIQVLQNHQSIKMLQGKEFADDVALNIKLRDDAKLFLIGQARAAAGVPKKYAYDIDAMMFKDKYKGINNFKGNNIGTDISQDLLAHNSNDPQKIDLRQPNPQLSLGIASDPELPSNRFLFNKVILTNLNNLYKLNNSLQLKINASYLYDSQQQYYENTTKTFLPDSVITYTERQDNRRVPAILHLQGNVNINNKNVYFNDAFVSDWNGLTAVSNANLNNLIIDQHLKVNPRNFSNELNYIFSLTQKLILNFNSYTSYANHSERLDILPGIRFDILNLSQPYSKLSQQLRIPSLLSNSYLSAKLLFAKQLIANVKLGLNYQGQKYQSSIIQSKPYIDSDKIVDRSINNLQWQQLKSFAEAGIALNTKKINFLINLPVVFQNIRYSDPTYSLQKTQPIFYALPELKMKYKLSNRSIINGEYKLMNEFGSIDQAYRGYVVKNFRTLYSNQAGIIRTTSNNYKVNFKFTRPEKLFFFNVDLNYLSTATNTITSVNTNQNYLSGEVIPFLNRTNNLFLNTSMSKYLFSLYSTVNVGSNFGYITTNLIQNGELLPYHTRVSGVNLGLEKKIYRSLNLGYTSNAIFTQSDSRFTNTAKTFGMQSNLSLIFSASKAAVVKITADRYDTFQTSQSSLNYTFIDASAKFSLPKPKVELEFIATNLIDTKSYTTNYLFNNLLSQSTYKLPGRILLLKLSFNY